ncbi:SLC13 family permease [Nitratireductor sp. L1-7-SE]|uniref:SLC13 family permease n=1 Tax=Nitratireductor rhodophyticola TaxID=2854036 RepID=A0ABS7REC8_9HYPH|nr:SLC13 family permease [Nitratireductor rhodophyticola]MBY8918760.1 SLC13 family permease [Nitratireductor rhodophyticola]MBY8920056.1 SLC13 family permease [Nitratireductor rhodophyticola]
MADFHLWATYAIILATVAAYVSERFTLEIVALGSLVAFLALFAFIPYEASGGLPPEELLSGFANPALATVLALLIVGQGLFATDALDKPARILAKSAGSSSTRTIIITLVTAAMLSAILNNTPVVVIFIPVLIVFAAQRNFPVSKALMPLSFMTILGGMTTLIGSSTNLLVAGVAGKAGLTIGFFDITMPGLLLAAAGALYVFFVMPRILRDSSSEKTFRQMQSGTQFIGEIRIVPGHPFIGKESKAGLFQGLGDLTPRLIVRRGMSFHPPFENVVLSEGDRLMVTATRRAFTQALSHGAAGHIAEAETATVGPDYHIAEAVIPPGSRHAGRTIRNAGIETEHSVHMLGVQRKSRMGRTPVSDIRLEPGDTILVGGTDRAFEDLRESHDLLVLEWSAEPVPQRRKAWIAFVIFAGIVVTAALDIAPIVATAVAGAFAMIATGCLTLAQAGRAFDRQIFLLVGSAIAAATALERTGGAQLIADGAVAALQGQSPAIILSGYFAVVAVLTNFLSNNATAVLFTPIALGISSAIGVPPEAFIAATIFAANCSFATPIGYQTNLMVMGPGHYSFRDFIKAGMPLVAIIWLTFSFVGPWYYGL